MNDKKAIDYPHGGNVSKDEYIKIVKERKEWVKAEKSRRMKEWKEEIKKAIMEANKKLREYSNLIDALDKEKNLAVNPEIYEKKIAELEKKIKKLKKEINELNKDISSTSRLEKKRVEILQQIMNEEEAKYCPFCGKDCGSAQGVKEHLWEKNDGPSDEELERMNEVAKRSDDYRENYDNAIGIKRYLVRVDLKEYSPMDIDVVEEIHHLTMIEPYASTLRMSRLGNLFGMDINEINNLKGVPAVDTKAFEKKFNIKYSNLTEEEKIEINKAIVEQLRSQSHDGGGHNTDINENVPSCEKILVQKLAELEYEVKMKGKKSGSCIGQTKKGRKKAEERYKEKIDEVQKDMRWNIELKFVDEDNPMFLSERNYEAVTTNKKWFRLRKG